MRVAVSSGRPVPGAGVRQRFVRHDLLAALAARLAGAAAGVVLEPRATRGTDVVVFPDDPAVLAPSRTALAAAPKGVRVERVGAFLRRLRLPPLDACESSHLRARLGLLGAPCVCDRGCYSGRCDPARRRCAPKRRR